jgi:ring-1,2-phenylacetyl-CoA epoxidase subunit PaaC
MLREEKYHLMHAHTWLRRLAEGSEEARRRQREAFVALWPDALGFFEPPPDEEALLAAGVLPEPFGALQQRWLAQIEEPLRRYNVPFPFVECEGVWSPLVTTIYGGRRGEHTAAFLALYEQMTSVYRLDPAATW